MLLVFDLSTPAYKTYLEAIESGRRATGETDAPRGLEAIGEEAFLGLRLIDGFVPSEELRRAFAGPWAVLKARGLALESDGRWKLSAEGVFLANDVFLEFVPPFQIQEATA